VLIVRFDPAGTGRSIGSDTTLAPIGTTTEERPPNVRTRVEPGTIADTPALPSTGSATAAEVSGSAAPPNALENRTRSRDPPTVTCTVWRSVVSSSTEEVPVNGAGGRLPGSVSCGIDTQLCIQRRPRPEAAAGPAPSSAAGTAAPPRPSIALRRMVRPSGSRAVRGSCT
jgi:hypothetical protein